MDEKKNQESIMNPSPANTPEAKPVNSPEANVPKKGFFSGLFGKSNPENTEDEIKRKEDCKAKCQEKCDKPVKRFYFFGGKKHGSKKNKKTQKKSHIKIRKSKSKKSKKSRKSK